MGKIYLHTKKGLNPRLTYCPRCGGDAKEIILMGYKECTGICPKCHVRILGISKRDAERCPKCKVQMYPINVKLVEDHERLPGGICDKCVQEMIEHKKIVEDGGIFFRCTYCHSEGIIKKDALIACEARKVMGILPPRLCGIEFDKRNCPVCNKKGEHHGI